MCAIAGFWLKPGRYTSNTLHNFARLMSDIQSHRGPDDEGYWVSPENGVGLSHRRLSIQDLSNAASQPMQSSCKRYVIVYNGETYSNDCIVPHLESKGIKLRGHSDTEVMLEAISCFGLEWTLEKLIGMFAFALWDLKKQTLTLVRDRIGIKPLYWGKFDYGIGFTSELKALTTLPFFHKSINTTALAQYLESGYIKAPNTIYQNVYKLTPGTLAVFSSPLNFPNFESFWNLESTIQNSYNNQFSSEEDALSQLHNLLKDSVAKRMLADVPLGAMLSGGIDSSLVVALMQSQSNQPIKTYSIGFHENSYNEAKYAKEIANHLKTDHTELYITPHEAIATIPNLPYIYDEPFADSSQIPTLLVSQLAKKHVQVALSGDGGDELFAGYYRHTLATQLLQNLKFFPGRKYWSRLFNYIPPSLFEYLDKFFSKKLPNLKLKNRIYKAQQLLQSESFELFYNNLSSHWQNVKELMPSDSFINNQFKQQDQFKNLIQFGQFIDTKTYLPDDILTKVDRASMATSLEVRVPLLDHRLLAMAWRIPTEMHLTKQGEGKKMLRDILSHYIPSHMFERPKMGFSVPIDQWLRTSLREWADDLLHSKGLDEFINNQVILDTWKQHLENKRNYQIPIWNILMLKAWHKQWI